MRIVALGDLHYYQLFTAPWNLVGKRVLGQMNLWLRRRKAFVPDALSPAIEHAISLSPDLFLFTGDLTTTALRPEFEHVRRVLKPVLDRFPALIIPGNHDRYTLTATRRRRIESFFPEHVPDTFPHARRLMEGWQLLAVDSAVPRFINARGRCGEAQLARMRNLIDHTTNPDALIVMCHYPAMLPPWINDKTGHRLDDAPDLRDVLRNAAPRKIVCLHGHVHRPWLFQPEETGLSHLTFINAGAPCRVSEPYPFGQGFWEIELDTPNRAPGHCVKLRHHVPRAPRRWEIDQNHGLDR